MPRPLEVKTLATLRKGEAGRLDRLDLADDAAERLMELGLIPGCRVLMEGKGPGGSCLCSVDGCVLALRRETAERLEVTAVR